MRRVFRAAAGLFRTRTPQTCAGHHWHVHPRGRHWTCCRCPSRSSTRKPPPVNDTGCALPRLDDPHVDWVIGLRVDT